MVCITVFPHCSLGLSSQSLAGQLDLNIETDLLQLDLLHLGLALHRGSADGDLLAGGAVHCEDHVLTDFPLSLLYLGKKMHSTVTNHI